MELEKQVVSLELARRLKELGVRQQSVFYWDEGNGVEDRLEYSPGTPLLELVSAFTVAELGEMLPGEIEQAEQSYWFTSERMLDNSWGVGFRMNGTRDISFVQDATTEADARAKMLVYLLENKLIIV